MNRGLVWLLALVGAGVSVLAVVVVARTAPLEQAATRAVVQFAVVGVPVAAGLYAIWASRHARFGFLLLAAGLLWSLTALAESSASVPYSIGRVAAWLIYPCVFYLVLAFPEDRVAGGLDRRAFHALNLVVAALFLGSALFVEAYPDPTPWATCRDDCPANAFFVLDRQPAVMDRVVAPLRELLAVGLLVGVTVSMALRRRTATPLQRRTMGPLMLTSGASAALLAGFFASRRSAPDAPVTETLGILWSLSVPAITLAFVLGLMQRRVLVAQVLTRLAPTLGDRVDTARLRDELAAALGDPGLEVLVPHGPARWRDSQGRIADGLPAREGRDVTIVRDEGAPAVALVHDAGLQADDELIAAVGSMVVAALRQQRLANRLATSLRQLESSRRRMVRAADLERARIERDLHDGAQQRLINLRIRLSLAEDLLVTDPSAGARTLGELGGEIDRTLEELRALAHGVYPSLLSDRGLADALKSIAAQAPLPVHLSILKVARHSPEIESAVYFACAEALQNAVKHAGSASGVWIALRENDHLSMEVRDDGPGFTPPPASHGGLRNMRDRLEAVGGTLIVDASPGRGTRVLGRVPLG